MFTRENVPTPALIVSLPIVRKNLARMADYCRHHNLKLRPHIKTHKSRFMADLQLQSGATGLTCAKIGEAELLGPLTTDCLLAYPALDPARAQRAAALAQKVPLRIAVDSALAIDRLADAAQKAHVTLGILIDIDVGFHRTGVQSPADALTLATRAARTPGTRFDGLMFYPGHIRSAPADQTPDLARINEILAATLDLLKKSGLPASIASGGSTPSAFQSHLLTGQTEIRPGTYIYNDRNTVLAGACTLADCAARIHATVISNAVPNKVVIDAGSKVFTSDPPRNDPSLGFGHLLEYPEARITRLSEEHGEIDLTNSPRRPQLGERLTILPNHICPCINLQNTIYLADENSPALTPLPIDARGQVV